MIRGGLVLPVRLAFGSRVVQTTTGAVGPQALFVRCVAPPGAGAQVELRLYLPDGAAEDLAGVVVAAPEGAGPGCQVELRGLTEEQRARLARFLEPPMLQRTPSRAPSRPPLVIVPDAPGAPPPGEPPAEVDQRGLTRVPVRLRVRFDCLDEVTDQLALNLSAGGMFVRVERPPPLHAEVTLAVELPGETEPLLCRAEVVHRVAPEEARSTGRHAGVGVQFLDADDRFRSEIDAFIARAQGLVPLDE